MKVTIDKEHGLAYITLVKEIKEGDAFRQVNFGFTDIGFTDIVLDFDREGRLLGIELLNLRNLHPDLAEGAEVASDAR